jgi:ABC-2 type transport system ATP-binding protein
MNAVVCNELIKQYGSYKAINELSFTFTENKITGLIGRNGAGKTTLLKIIAGYLLPSSGEVRVFGERPFNNLNVSAHTIFIDNEMSFSNGLTLFELLETAGSFYPNWDRGLAHRLFSYFSFNPSQYHGNLSKGMRSTFNMIIGLSSRCPLTIFDEPTSGMDSPTRNDFYRALLKEYIAHPRTIILSSHLLEEVEDLLEDILLINSGEKYLHMGIEDLKQHAVGVRGEAETVTRWISGIQPIHVQEMGAGMTYAVIENERSKKELEEARILGLEIALVSAEKLCSYLTKQSRGGIDYVFNRG